MLESALADNVAFLSGAALTINVPGLTFSEAHVQSILDACEARGVAARAIVAGGRPIYGAVATAPRAGVPGREPSTDVTSPEIVSGECGMVVGTVRSGH
ncbi:MAG: hypothetical protein ACYC5O_11575, partial [Anaerolineae bacterium]